MAQNVFQDVGGYSLRFQDDIKKFLISPKNSRFGKKIQISHGFFYFHLDINAEFHIV